MPHAAILDKTSEQNCHCFRNVCHIVPIISEARCLIAEIKSFTPNNSE